MTCKIENCDNPKIPRGKYCTQHRSPIAKKCEHNKQKNKCKECDGTGICKHKRVKRKCVIPDEPAAATPEQHQINLIHCSVGGRFDSMEIGNGPIPDDHINAAMDLAAGTPAQHQTNLIHCIYGAKIGKLVL